jgi:chromosomal replication initiation ATPase DnaA
MPCPHPTPIVPARPRRASRRAAVGGRIPLVVGLVCGAFDLTPAQIYGPSRGRARIAFARQVAMYVAHVWLGLSLSEVGRRFGRDRTTVAHACIVIEDRREDPVVDATLDVIESAAASWQDFVSECGRA